jgi:transposase
VIAGESVFRRLSSPVQVVRCSTGGRVGRRRDVIAVPRQGDESRTQVARGFGTSESCLARWLRIADPEGGTEVDSSKPADEAELRELRKRNKQLEQENEILGKAAAAVEQVVLPTRPVPARRRVGH